MCENKRTEELKKTKGKARRVTRADKKNFPGMRPAEGRLSFPPAG